MASASVFERACLTALVAVAAVAMHCGGTRIDALEAHPTPSRPPPQHTTTALLHYGVDTPAGKAALAWFVGPEARKAVDDGLFDGLMLDVGKKNLMDGTISADAFAEEIGMLRGAGFQHLVENFQVAAVGEADWFDDATWARVAANAGQLATVAQRAGLRGLFFDVQAPKQWKYDAVVSPKGPFTDYEAQAKLRGHQVMTAILGAYPDVTLLLPLAFTVVYVDACLSGGPLPSQSYGLLPSFLDGMLAAQADLRAPSRMIDAFLLGYPTRDPAAFRLYYDLVHFDAVALAAHWVPDVVTYHFVWSPDGQVPNQSAGEFAWPRTPATVCDAETLAKVTRSLSASFGIMLDFEVWNRPPLGTDAASQAGDYRPPAQLETVVRTAFATSDRYVWTWASQPFWPLPGQTGPLVPPAYVDALSRARTIPP